MPDEQQDPSGETPQAQPEGENPQGSAPQGEAKSTDKPADFEAWLAAQPDEIKTLYETHTGGLKSALDKERKANKKRDDDAARKAQEAQEAQLSEAEKAQKKLAQIEKERDELAAQMRQIRAREALVLVAEKEKIEFASPQAMRDAFEIALKAAEFDDDGQLQGPASLLKASIKDRDYLLKKPTAQPPGDTSATKRGESSAPVMDEETKREFAAIYGIDPRYLPATSR